VRNASEREGGLDGGAGRGPRALRDGAWTLGARALEFADLLAYVILAQPVAMG